MWIAAPLAMVRYTGQHARFIDDLRCLQVFAAIGLDSKRITSYLAFAHNGLSQLDS